MLAPKAHLVCLDPWENAILVFLDLRESLEFLKLDFLGFLD